LLGGSIAVHFQTKTMKKILLSLLTITAFGFSTKAQITDLPVTASPTLVCSGSNSTITTTGSQLGVLYTLRNSSNTIIDGPIAGTGNDLAFFTGAINSVETYNVLAEKGTTALSFDGVNDYVNLTAHSRNISGLVTISCWLKTSSTGTTEIFLSKYDGVSKGYYLFFDVNGKAGFSGRGGQTGSTGARGSGLSTTSVNDGQWHYITGSANITTGVWSIYIDATLENSTNFGSNLFTNDYTMASSANFYVGAYSNFYLMGEIDDVSIWDKELTQLEIQTYMTTCLTGSEAGIRGLFDFNEGIGSTVTDLSITSFNGSLINMLPAGWTNNLTSVCASSLQMTQTALVSLTSISDQTLSGATSICLGDSVVISTGNSETGINYSLIDAAGNRIDGPITGTGSALNFNTGTIATSTTYSVLGEIYNGTINNALRFDGINDLLSLTYQGRNISTQVTVSCWLKTSSAGTTEIFASKYNGSSAGYYLYFDANGKAGFSGRGGLAGSSNGRTSGISSTDVNDGQWHYITGSANITTGVWSIYIDATLENSVTYGTTSDFSLASSSNFLVGGYSTTFFLSGEVDDLSIWDTALNQSSIQSNMNNCLSGSENNLVGLFNFNENNTISLTDYSSFSIDGVLLNMNSSTDWMPSTASSCNSNNVICDFTMTQTETITVLPSYNQTEVLSVCSGGSYTFPDGTTQNNITSQVIYTSNLQTVNAGCDSIIETTVNINPIYNQSESVSVCSGGSYTFPDGTTQNNITTQVIYTSNLQTVNAGCDSIIETTVNIDPIYNQSESVSVCSGGSYTFSDGTTQNNITSQVIYNSNLQTVNAGCDSIIVTTVNVFSVIDTTTSTNGNVITVNQTGATYQWLDCNNAYALIIGATSQTYTAIANGNYAVEVTTNSSCVDTSACVTIASVGLSENKSSNKLSIYPNPATTHLTIDVAAQIESIRIIDLNGKIVKEETQNTRVVAINNLPKGLYFLQVKTDKGLANSKFIKE